MNYLGIVQDELANKDISFEAIESIAELVEKADYSVLQVIKFCEELGSYLGDI